MSAPSLKYPSIKIPSPKTLLLPTPHSCSDSFTLTESSSATICSDTPDDTNKIKDDDSLPAYLQLFHDSGISEARLRRFSWLHPKNYTGEGSLSDDYTLSVYGTSVSSPRGDDEWEIVDRGKTRPRKSIDALWDEVFEYQQRIKLIKQIHQVQVQAAFQLQYPDPELHQNITGDYLPDRGSSSSDNSETCSSLTTTLSSIYGGSSILSLASTSAILSQSSMTKIDKTVVHATKSSSRSDGDSAMRQLHSAIQKFS